MHGGLRKNHYLVPALGTLIFFFGALLVQAQTNGNSNVPGNTNGNVNAIANGNTNATRLEAAKLRVCQNREAAINRILSRIARRAERQMTVFDAIATRVEMFYARRGLTIENYNALLTDINGKKGIVQAAVETLNDGTTFSCTSEDPRGIVTEFKDNLQSTNNALKEYRTAIRNLIVAVKSAVGQDNSNSNANENTNSGNSNVNE